MNRKFFIGGAIILVAVVFLSYMGFRSSATYYYEVNELLQNASSLQGKAVRVGGEVAPDIKREVGKLDFRIIDVVDRQTSLRVEYQGAVPDTFKESRHVIVEGKYTTEGTFKASSIITKCPSKYEAATDTPEK